MDYLRESFESKHLSASSQTAPPTQACWHIWKSLATVSENWRGRSCQTVTKGYWNLSLTYFCFPQTQTHSLRRMSVLLSWAVCSFLQFQESCFCYLNEQCERNSFALMNADGRTEPAEEMQPLGTLTHTTWAQCPLFDSTLILSSLVSCLLIY